MLKGQPFLFTFLEVFFRRPDLKSVGPLPPIALHVIVSTDKFFWTNVLSSGSAVHGRTGINGVSAELHSDNTRLIVYSVA